MEWPFSVIVRVPADDTSCVFPIRLSPCDLASQPASLSLTLCAGVAQEVAAVLDVTGVNLDHVRAIL